MDRTTELVRLHEEHSKPTVHESEISKRGLRAVYGYPPVSARQSEESDSEQDPTIAYLSRYDAIIGEARAIFEERNRAYGSAIEYTGLVGAIVQIVGDYNRVRNLVVRSVDHGRGQKSVVRDKLLDILNYCVIALLMLEKGNFEGKD